MRLRGVIALAAMLLIAASCTRPQSTEQFVRMDQAQDSTFAFSIDLSDSTCTYDISFFTHFDIPVHAVDTLASFPMDVEWKAPSGLLFRERVWYPVHEECVLYRSGVETVEKGEFGLSVRVFDAPKGMRGIGVVCKRNDR